MFLLARAEPAKPGVFSTPLFRALACCSYSFYMLHAFVGEGVFGIASKLIVHRDSVWMFSLLPVALVVTTLISIASFRFLRIRPGGYLGVLAYVRPRLGARG